MSLVVRSFLGNPVATGCVACVLELASWIYRAASFIVVSVTFPSMPSPDPAAAGVLGGVLEGVGGDSGAQGAPPHEEAALSPSATASGCSWMVMVTASQFAAVLITIRRYSYDSLFNTGELAVSFCLPSRGPI
ncbi:hypothetical protein BHM03_00038437 [Ensete ventricosum]|nr:hypothetical protein BHM03_00038437 [Ensete ventricosum]